MRSIRLAVNLSLPADLVTQTTATDGDLHWAAGILEGEGTISIAVRNQDETYRLMVTVANTDRSVVEFFQRRWPGWFQAKAPQPRRKQAYVWTVAGPRGAAFLETIRPYVRTSRVLDKIATALEFRSFQSTSKRNWGKPEYRIRQRGLYLHMRDLNRRGRQAEARS